MSPCRIVLLLNILLTFIRIKDWLHILGLTALGITFYSNSSLFTYQALLGLIVSALYLAHGFSLNNYFDIAIDQHIGKNFFSPGQTSHKKFLVISYALLFINCVISYKISPIIFYLVTIGSITGLIYSAPPLRLKRITFLNILLNSLGFSIIFLIGFASVSKSISPTALMMTVLLALVFIPLQIVHQISHSEGDKEGNIQTIYIRYGFKKTVYFFDFSLALLFLWSLLIGTLDDKYIYIFYATLIFCFSLFYFMQWIKKSGKIYAESAIKIRFLSRKICIFYGIIMLLIFYFIN